MKKIVLISTFFLLFFFGFVKAQNHNVSVTIQDPLPVCNSGDYVDLTATYDVVETTTDYRVESIPYNPIDPFIGGLLLPRSRDDSWSKPFTLPFNFCFYGQYYNVVYVGSNGVITFDVDQSNNFTYVTVTDISDPMYPGYYRSPYQVAGGPLPSATFDIKNAVFGVYQDTNLQAGIATEPTDVTIQNVNYYVTGTAPNRKFIANFNELALYGSSCGPGYPGGNTQTSQIVLYETSNVIEVNIKRRNACTGWNGGKGVVGVINRTGLLARVPGGRNVGAWSTTNEAWRFVPDGNTITSEISWLEDGVAIPGSTGLSTISINPTQDVEYTAVVQYTQCDNTINTISDVITVGPEPFVLFNEPEDIRICVTGSGPYSFNLDQDALMLNLADPSNAQDPSNFYITYHASEADAIAGFPSINPGTNPGELSNYLSNGGETIWVAVQDFWTNGCIQYRSFDLLVQADPSGDIAYTGSPYCTSDTNTYLPSTNTVVPLNGNFEATPPGLSIDATTGEITPATSAVGTYSVKYKIPVTSTCPPYETPPVEIIIQDCSSCSLALDTNFGPASQTICLGNSIADIVYNYGGDATSFDLQFTPNLPAGLSVNIVGSQLTITGTPTETGTFNYGISTLGCTSNIGPLAGTIEINLPSNAGTLSGNQTICENGTTVFTSDGDTGGSWSSDDVNVATVDTSGNITGVGAGTATITYEFPANGTCPPDSATLQVTVTANVPATFAAIAAQCPGGSNPLPTTSQEGFTGTWSPAFDANNTGSYVFIPDTTVTGQECALPSASVTVTITTAAPATFASIPAQCEGGSNPLPSTSLEGWSGAWSPAFDANNTGSYVFIPDTTVPGQECALPSAPVSVTITPQVQATFASIPAQCANGSNPLPTTSQEGFTGTWSPVFDANNTGSYVFTPDTTVSGQECALQSAPVAVTITPQVQATFASIPAQCAGGSNPLPTTSQEGFTGAWSPAFDANNTGSYVFIPDTTVTGQECALPSASVTVTITTAAPATFAAIPAQCEGGSNPLPSTSLEGWSGAWSPAFDANNSGSYVFIPDTTVSGQECALQSAPVSVTITPQVQATFASIPAQCANGSNPLPTTSQEGFTGTWSPVFDANNTGSYVFTPDTTVSGQECALQSAPVAVTITPQVQATFAAIAAQCAGGSNPLPTTSQEGFTGTWSPAFDANNTGSYVFIPDTTVTGQECALQSASVTVTITTAAPATFAAIPAQCEGGSNPLPSTSLEGWSGAWSPAFDANNSGSYVFIPDTTVSGQECALQSAPVAVTITPQVQATFATIPAQCANGSNPLPTTSQEGFTGTWSPVFDANNTGSYVFTPDTTVSGQECALQSALVAVTINPLPVAPTVSTPVEYCLNESAVQLTATSSSGSTLLWYTVATGGTGTTTAPTPSTAVAGVTSYWVSQITSNGCEGPRAEIQVNVHSVIAKPIVTVIAPSCGVNGGAQISNFDPDPTLNYSFTPPGPLYDMVGNITNLVYGTSYEVTASVASCSVTSDPFTVNQMLATPSILVTNNSPSICDGDMTNIVVTGLQTGETLNWIVNANEVNGLISGQGTSFTDAILTLFSGIETPRVVNIRFYADNGSCTSSFHDIDVTVNPRPDIMVSPNTPEEQTICSGETTNIEISSTYPNVTFSWEVISNVNGVVGASNGTGDTIAQTLSVSGTLQGVVVYRLHAFIGSCESANTIDFTVYVNPKPVYNPIITPTAICDGASINLNYSHPDTNITFGWDLVLTNADVVGGILSGVTTTNSLNLNQAFTLVDSLVSGQATFTVWVDLNGCKSDPFTATVDIHPNPQVQLQDGAICVQDGQVYQTYWLNAGVLPLGGDYEYEWFMVDTAGDISLGTTPTPYYEVVMAGDYYVVVTNVDVLLGTNCSGVSNTVTVIETNPATLANATAVVTEFFTGSGVVTITVTDGNGTLEYQLDEGEFQSSNVFTGVSAGPHTVTVVDTQGCTYFTIPVLVVDYPKFFTPNGDGYNDTWNIIGLEQENAKLYIFDRYGKLIKQINTLGANQGNGWDGTLNGKPLPSTDYWFSLEYEENGIMKEFKAHFSLKR